MDLFELQAKIELDSSEYERGVKSATDKAESIEDAFQSVGDSAEKSEKDIEGLSDELHNSGRRSTEASREAVTLANKVKVLERQYEEASDEVEKLTDAFNESVMKTGEASEETQELAAKLKTAESRASSLEDELDSMQSELDKNRKGFLGLTDSLAGSILKADLLSKGFGLVASAAKSLALYVWNLDEATEEYRTAMTKLDTAFQTNGFNASVAESAFKNLYIAVGDIDRATEASQLLANLATNTADVATWTDIATGIVATFGDSLPVESLIEAANETSRTGTVVGTLADALNWAGTVGEDDFNAMLASCATQEERVQLITETLIGTYGEAANTFDETAETVMSAREAHLRLAEAQAEVGKETERLKNALSHNTSYTLIGLNTLLGSFTGKLANVAEESAESKNKYDDFLNSIDTKIQSDNIEDVAEAIRLIKEEAKSLEESGTFSGLGIFGNLGYASELSSALDDAIAQYNLLASNGDELQNSMDGVSSGASDLTEKLNIVTASANGFSVELTNSGLSAEEASNRLQTYTDATLNMFSQISTESEISYSEAVANLEANIQATQDFANNMTEIASVLPGNLAEVFSAGGPGVYAGVVSMLAEANRGTDEGLTQINDLWSQGGEEAVNAFISSLGMVPADTENPATIVSSQMEQDTSMEIAAEGVVERTYSAMSSSVASSGFDSVGKNIGLEVASGLESSGESAYSAGQAIINRFIDGMNSRKNSATSTASSIGSAAANALNGSSGRYSAGGLDYVPYDGYPIIAHKGETLLTASEAKEYRSGMGAGGGITIIQNIQTVPQTPAELAATAQAYFEQARWAV